ncbi:MAG: putative signal peptide protein, partial [bacterium]|nr:putative signal peptide protein [bacterium]
MIPTEKRRFYIFSGSALAAALLLAVGFTTFSASGRARRIAAKSAAARGGLDAWRAVKSMTMSGKLDAGVRRDPVKLAMAYQNQARLKAKARVALATGASPTDKPVQLPFTMELKRPRKSRLEIRFEGDTAVQVYDGKQGWKLRPFLGRREVEQYSAEELHTAAQQADLDGWLLDAAAKGNRLELVGTDKVEGRDAYNIKVTMKDGQVRHVWVDTQSFLEVRIDGTRRFDGKPRPVWTYFRNYKKVDGVMIPHVMETIVDGVPGSEKIVVDRVVINPPLADTRFARLDPALVGAESTPLMLAAGGATSPAGGDANDPHAHHHDAAHPLERATRSTVEYKLPEVTLQRDDGKSVSF